jgi:hypothetical protein
MCVLRTNTGAGAAIPGQAFLLAEIMDVFALVGQEMIDRGNFFATMFIVMAAGCWLAYFVLGVSTTKIAHVSPTEYAVVRLSTNRSTRPCLTRSGDKLSTTCFDKIFNSSIDPRTTLAP